MTTIRQAGLGDLDTLFRLAQRTLVYESFSRELLQEKLFSPAVPERDDYHTYLLEVGGRIVGMLQVVLQLDRHRAWLGLFGVDPDYQRRGLGRSLWNAAEDRFEQAGIQSVDMLTIPENYLTPGLDPRYTPAICFAERLGFHRVNQTANMRAALDQDYRTQEQEHRLASVDLRCERATEADEAALQCFFAEQFGEGWHAEALLAMRCDPPGLHLAWKGDRIVGFAAHSAMNAEWGNFGPMGVCESVRKKGVGRILLYRCMQDLKAAGHASAVIPWIGPHRFYSDALGARIERVFWQYRLDRVRSKTVS